MALKIDLEGAPPNIVAAFDAVIAWHEQSCEVEVTIKIAHDLQDSLTFKAFQNVVERYHIQNYEVLPAEKFMEVLKVIVPKSSPLFALSPNAANGSYLIIE